VLVFRQKFSLEDAIEFNAFAPLEANMRVTNGMPFGSSRYLPVGTVNSAQTLQGYSRFDCKPNPNPKHNHEFRPNTAGLGTGSVKQVHKAKLLPHSTTPPAVGAPTLENADGASGEEVAVGLLRMAVEDEALSSLEALRASPELEAVAKRLGR
jgi:hypothetical protein